MFLVEAEPMPLCVVASYLIEKHKKEVYNEDCNWLQSVQFLKEKQRDILKQPYLQSKQKIKKEISSKSIMKDIQLQIKKAKEVTKT